MIRPAVSLFILATFLQPSSGKSYCVEHSRLYLTIRDLTAGQSCDGTETFEKVTGVRLAGAREVLLTGGNTGRTVTALCNNR